MNITPILIVAPHNRIAMRYAYLQHITPGARTLLEAEQVYGYDNPVILCLVGDRNGTFNVTPHSAANAEKLVILERMHYCSILYRWFDESALPTLPEAIKLITASVPRITSLEFKPPMNEMNFGVVLISFSNAKSVLYPLSSEATPIHENEPRLLYEVVAGIIDECRDRLHRWDVQEGAK